MRVGMGRGYYRASNVRDHMKASERRSSVFLSVQFCVGRDWRNMMMDYGRRGGQCQQSSCAQVEGGN